MWRCAIAASMLGGAGPAAAADLYPGRAALDRAALQGTAIARRAAGYPFARHILFEVADARAADPASGMVDAIILATPLERVRHAAYLAMREGAPIDGAAASRQADAKAGQIVVLVFAHGRNEDDAAFARRFGPASLTFGSGARVDAVAEPGEPETAIFPRADGERARPVATITFRFDLSGRPDAGSQTVRLRLIDPSGRLFDLPIALGRYP